MPKLPSRHIHLLYVPTMGCNLGCSYCYLGKQTTEASIKQDAAKALSTLQYALQQLKQSDILAFNVSLHGGEVTTLPTSVLEELFITITQHYRDNFDALNALGHKKSSPHIKTNLYRFAPLYELFQRHKVSISASIDLPLKLHERYRTTRAGTSWLERTKENIKLLAQYPHAKKISATLSSEHLQDIPALIDDIWYIHRELGFDMNQMNLMFAFGSELNRLNLIDKGETTLTPTTSAQQQELYDALQAAFMGTELEDGLKRNWFDEFKPSYCTNSVNCGERFYLLQGDGSVYSCVRGQGIPEFHYGNIFESPIIEILENGARKIRTMHQKQGFHTDCQSCSHLRLCNTGCPVVKYQNHAAKSYTCELQKTLYADAPFSYPADELSAQKDYADYYQDTIHPQTHAALPLKPVPQFIVPSDTGDEKNTLHALIQADTTLQTLFSPTLWVLEVAGEKVALESQLPQLRQTPRIYHTLLRNDRVVLHVHRHALESNSPEWLRNTIYLQLLRDTLVVYGDEQRTKQEHIFTYQLYLNCLTTSELLGENYYQFDISDLLAMHRQHFQRGVLNNLFFTTFFLREYHYQKQKNNAFYHLQTANLPFQNFEFYYL